MTRVRGLVAALAAAPLLAGCLLAGCAGPDGTAVRATGSGRPAPFAGCAGLTSPVPAGPTSPVPAGPTSPARTGGAGPGGAGPGGAESTGKPLPDLRLPCFTGDQTVDIGRIRGPALVNLWASWCAPCRAELPAFQRYAARAGGRVHVVGVVSSDERDAAETLARQLGVTFPAIFDREALLLGRVGRTALPVTVLVDARGRISYTYNAQPLDDTAIARLAERYLGVRVPS